jgi:hypothetical protein
VIKAAASVPCYDFSGGGEGLFGFLLQYSGACGAALVDGLCGLGVRLRHYFLALVLDPVQLGFDFFCVRKALSDLLPPLLQHREDTPIGKLVKHQAHDAETDDLRSQVGQSTPKFGQSRRLSTSFGGAACMKA